MPPCCDATCAPGMSKPLGGRCCLFDLSEPLGEALVEPAGVLSAEPEDKGHSEEDQRR